MSLMRRLPGTLLLVAIVGLSACGSPNAAVRGPELPTITPDELETLLTTSNLPTVVNIWASWCIPCRSEAPLLRRAHERFDGEVSFIGIAVADQQGAARDFISEFGIGFENYFDRSRSIPASLSRTGVPLTFFFDAQGLLVHVHAGVIDERTLAVNIDELLVR